MHSEKSRAQPLQTRNLAFVIEMSTLDIPEQLELCQAAGVVAETRCRSEGEQGTLQPPLRDARL